MIKITTIILNKIKNSSKGNKTNQLFESTILYLYKIKSRGVKNIKTNQQKSITLSYIGTSFSRKILLILPIGFFSRSIGHG